MGEIEQDAHDAFGLPAIRGIVRASLYTRAPVEKHPKAVDAAPIFAYKERAMKLIIQIPCYNEEATVGDVIRELPREIPGVDEVEVLVVDDGSTDGTVAAAREAGTDHVLSLGMNRGLARAFMEGIRACLDRDADIVVNTDGDHQYQGRYVADLIRPILEERAEVVIGARPIDRIEQFSWIKKRLQRFGSWVVRRFSRTDISDTTSGFRAYTAEAALRLHVFNPYTYTLETIVQAGHDGMRIGEVPIETNPVHRQSRLIKSTRRYIWNAGGAILRAYAIYKPMATFWYMALLPGVTGLALCVRFLYFYVNGGGSGHVQSLILAAILLIIALQLLVLGVVADIVGANRKLMHECLFLLRKQRTAKTRQPDHELDSSPTDKTDGSRATG